MQQGGTYLRVILSRFLIEREVVSQVLQISATSFRRHSRMGSEVVVNHISRAILEVTAGMINRRIKGQPATTACLFEVKSFTSGLNRAHRGKGPLSKHDAQ